VKTSRILIIEDNPRDRRLVEIALSECVECTFELLGAGTLMEAKERLADFEPDVVLLDLNLPDSHGMDTLRAVRGLVPQSPVVVLTGMAEEDMGDEAIRNGAQDFLVKGKMFGELLFRSIRYARERHNILLQLQEATALA